METVGLGFCFEDLPIGRQFKTIGRTVTEPDIGDMGADVIKIETPDGDPNRQNGPARHANMAAMHLNMNRNKRSITLNLKRPEAREALLRLVDTADVYRYEHPSEGPMLTTGVPTKLAGR